MQTRLPCDEAQIEATPVRRPAGADTGRWVLAATIIGSSMALIDGSVVSVALPVIQTEFRASVAEMQWVVEAYALLLGALMLTGGALGDHLGRRKVFAAGVIFFAAASAWCAVASNSAQLIAGRAVQGVAGALLVPSSLAIIGASFAADRRGQAIGAWSALSSIITAFGPILGGWFVQYVSWRAAFLINVALAAIVLPILYLRVPESRNGDAGASFDVAGTVLAALGLGGLVFGLVESANLGLGHPLIIGTMLAGLFFLAAFIVVEARSPAPMMPLGLFRSRTFAGANLLTLLLYAAIGAIFFFLPFNLIQVQGYSATGVGLAILPFYLILSALSRWSGGLVDRFGSRLPLVLGPSVSALGFALFAVPGIGGTYWTTFFPAVAVLGLGMSITVAPLSTAVMGAVATQRAGVASGINNAISRVGGLLAVAVLGILAVTAFSTILEERLDQLQVPPRAREVLISQSARLAAAEVPPDIDEETNAALERAVDEAFVHSFRLVMLVCAGLALAGALSTWALVENRVAAVETE